MEAIGRGQQPAELSAETLLNRIDLPLPWSEQLSVLAFSCGISGVQSDGWAKVGRKAFEA